MAPWLLLLCLLDQAAPSPASSFEGETIASVRIEAPGGEAARIERYLELRPGQAFHASDVRHVVEVLFAAGEFEDVAVEAERVPAGLAVVFRTRPAPFLAGVRIEGDPVLSAKGLRRIVRLSDREPLWPARLEKAAQEAALHLAREGYLEARVTAAAERMPRGAVAVFSVRSGPRARVGEARLEGLSRAAAERLSPLARPRRGAVYGREAAQEAAERIRKRLVEEGRWRAAVEVRDAYEPATARVRLTFLAQPGALSSVEFRGDRPPASLRGALEELLREGGLKADVLEEAAERIEETFRRRGHRDVVVRHHEEPSPARELAVFETRAGPMASVASVRIVGAPAGLERILSTRPGEPLEDRLLEAGARALMRALEDEGHAEAKVEIEASEGGGPVPVVFRVRPGPRTLLRSVSVASPVPLEGAPGERRTQEGRPYRVRDLALDRNALLAALRNAGHLDAEVAPEVAFSEDRTEARIVFRVAPGARTLVDHIVVASLEHTREETLRRELLVKEGEPLGLQKVLESQRRLGALGVLRRVSVAEMDPESIGRRSLVVTAEEAPRTAVAYGVGYAERDLVRLSAEVTRRNLSGLDRSLSSFARFSFGGNTRLLMTYREPYLFGRKQEFFVTGFREEEDRATFDFTRFGGLLQTASTLTGRVSLILRYAFQKTRVFAIEVPLEEVDRQFRDSTVSGPSASVFHDTRDDPLDPRSGGFVGADVQLSHKALGGDGFVKGFLQGSAYRRLDPRVTLALSARLGLARTLGSGVPARLPLPDRFFAGGDYSLRGFQLDTAGPLEPGTTGQLFPTGGNALLLGGAELRVDAGRYVSLAAFGEAGNVYPLVSDVDLAGLRTTAGVGLRYKSALGPIRIDWGYKLNRRAGEDAYRFHFTIGHAF